MIIVNLESKSFFCSFCYNYEYQIRRTSSKSFSYSFHHLRHGYINHDQRYVGSRIGPAQDEETKKAYLIFLEKMVPKDKELSAFVALEYNEGCTSCNNFKTAQEIECVCESVLPPTVLGGRIE